MAGVYIQIAGFVEKLYFSADSEEREMEGRKLAESSSLENCTLWSQLLAHNQSLWRPPLQRSINN